MPNDSEGPIVVFDTSVVAINLALQQVLERLDMVKGLRGDPTIYAATTVGAPGAREQAARLADLPSENPSNPLFYLLAPKSSGVSSAPTALTDGSGGTANDTLTALGGITALTDNTGGTATNTLLALGGTTVLTDSSGGTADNTIAVITNANNAGSADVVPTANAIADLAAKVNVLILDLTDARDNEASLSAKVNALIADMDDCKNNFADVAAKINALRSALIAAEVLY